MSDLDRCLAAIALDQRMLVTIDDVRRAGGRRDHAERRVNAGRWRQVEHGVYLIAGAPVTWETRALASVLAAGDGATVSHLAAARLWGLPGYGNAEVEVSIPRGRRYRRPGLRTHESTDLDRCVIVDRGGIPVTDPARTLLDLGRYVGVRRLRRSVEAARRQRLVTWAVLIASHARHARRGRPGTRRLREVILLDADREAITDTDMELMVLALIREAGLPTPVLHHRVHDGERFVAEVDLAYPLLKIAIECDGSAHLDEHVRERDLPRQNDLVLLGWTVLRFSYLRLRTRPDAVIREIRDAIHAAMASS